VGFGKFLVFVLKVFDEVFKKSAVKRTKFEGLKRNLKFLKK